MVVDANKVAAALIKPNGDVVAALRREDLEFYAPHFLIEDLEEHLGEYAAKAGCPARVMHMRIVRLVATLQLVPVDALLKVRDDPLVLQATRIDPDDAPSLATVAAVGADLLWTSDKALREAFPDLATAVLPSKA